MPWLTKPLDSPKAFYSTARRPSVARSDECLWPGGSGIINATAINQVIIDEHGNRVKWLPGESRRVLKIVVGEPG